MRVNEIVLLKEAVEDLENGESFYNDREPGAGTYFWDSIISDIGSLVIFAGIDPKKVWTFPDAFKKISIFNLLRNC